MSQACVPKLQPISFPPVLRRDPAPASRGRAGHAPAASGGSRAADRGHSIAIFPGQLLSPGATLAITLVTLNYIGHGIRAALDPHLRTS